MNYQRLGRTGIEVSRLGFGAMRLPASQEGKPDAEESVRVIHRAFEHGVNYIDTAVMYCQFESQPIVGQALRAWRERAKNSEVPKGAPERVYVSTKNHYYGTDERVWWRNLENSLERLGVERIDVYNLHGMNWKQWETSVKGPGRVLSWIRKAHDQGLIQHICCSFHDNAEALDKIANTDEFASITLQYNLLDRQLEPVLPKLIEKDIGVIVMGPVAGGRLATASDPLAGALDGVRSTAELALRFVLDNPSVSTAISGMSSIEQVEENCATANRTEPLSEEERTQVTAALERLKGLADLYCTGCDYCLPCASGVQISRVFTAVNYDRVYGLTETARNTYRGIVGKPTYCVACGACEPKCPQNIPIRVQLREAAALFEPAYGRMALDLTPVRRSAGGVAFRARLHNLSDARNTATVKLSEPGGAPVTPSSLDAAIDEPFHCENRSVVVSPKGADVEPLELAAATSDASGEHTETYRFVLGSCHKAESLEHLRGRATELAPLILDRDDQVVMGDDLSPRPFVLHAWPGYTEDHFLLYAEVRRQDGEEGPREGGNLDWSADVVLDLRNRNDEMAPGFHEAVFMLRVGRRAGRSPESTVLRGSLANDQVRIDIDAGHGLGCKVLQIQIPWEPLAELEDMPDRGFEQGDAFGFDIAVGCTDHMDRQIYRIVWSGNPRLQADARTGTLFFT